MSRDVVFVLAICGLIASIGAMLLRPDEAVLKVLFGISLFALSYALRTNDAVRRIGANK